ncbi:hypothetical protein GALL_488170 [mine drainage metagenome]|uniref:Uncharacterized protein n=1 Tax=mine drainage metagenome TaxID=410659 RepID=A0A1J5Q136_9ZZZZ
MRNGLAHASSESSKLAKAGLQHRLDSGLDLARQHGSRALGANRHDHRIAINDRGGKGIAKRGLIDGVDQSAAELGKGMQREICGGAAGGDEYERSVAEGFGRDRARVVTGAVRGDKRCEFGIERGGEERDARLGLEHQAGLLRGLLAPACDDNAAAGHGQEHRKGFHAGAPLQVIRRLGGSGGKKARRAIRSGRSRSWCRRAGRFRSPRRWRGIGCRWR